MGPKKFIAGRGRVDRYIDMSKQDDFIFNRTPILASALERLKGNDKHSNKLKKAQVSKRKLSEEDIQQVSRPTKKVKRDQTDLLPSLAYTPLQKDLYSFFTINKSSLKGLESIPEPKLEVGSLVLAAICDRGIGGKFLVVNLFRNKKGYIDFKEISQFKKGDSNFEGIQAYTCPGDYVVCSVVKGMNSNHIQLSLRQFIDVSTKCLKTKQVLPAQVKSKQEMGCHLLVNGCQGYKFFLPQAAAEQEWFEELQEKKQILVTISDIDHTHHLVKVQPTVEDSIGFNLRGISEQEMCKLELEQYVTPGTLVQTKIVKIVQNGVIVKFLKIFIGFIHLDHLNGSHGNYSNDQKIQARIIYACMNPPLLYLSEKHADLHCYRPSRALYSAVSLPKDLEQIQGCYLDKGSQFFVHPTQLHSEIENISKFWIKENNYFERYQIMTSRKLGLRVGEIAKEIPFNNFKVFGDQQSSRFRVMCLDVWNKVVKVSADQKVLKSKNMLYDIEEIDMEKQYCGFISGFNQQTVTVEFCNNIKGSLPKHELKMQQLSLDESSIGQGLEVYIAYVKQKNNFITLSLVPPVLRKGANHKNRVQEGQSEKKQETLMGTILSIEPRSITPLYLKTRSGFAKISIFEGIRPASVQNLSVIQQLNDNFKVGDRLCLFKQNKKYYLYPPEQLSDRTLRICRVVDRKGNQLRLQVSKDQFRNCHICDISDNITPYPLQEVQIGEYRIGRLLPNGNICLRESVVINGIPKNILECKQHYGEDEERGDYRNRILTVGSAGLKEGMVMFGYVKAYSDKGCFVSVSNDFQVRIEISQLSDRYIADKAKFYPQNKLMFFRIIGEKVKANDASKHLFDASARESTVKLGFPLKEELLQVGLTVTGIVSAFSKGKALIRIDGSHFTGIMHPNDVQNIDKQQPIEISMKLGTRYSMKIIEYRTEGARLIRLSTLTKYFNKYKDIQIQMAPETRVVNLYESYLAMIKQPMPAETNEQPSQLQEQNQDEEYLRIKKLLAQQQSDLEGELVQQQSPQQQMQQQNPQLSNNQQQVSAEQQMSEQPKSQFNDPSEINRKLSQFRQMGQDPKIYQSIILANDSSQSHIQYISSMINNPQVTPEQIRVQFDKSIAMLESMKQKENMWVAWLNMEIILGDFSGVVAKAVNANVGTIVYSRIIQILSQQQKWDLAMQMVRKLLKKFNRDCKAYVIALKQIVQEQIHSGNSQMSYKDLMMRASQCLNSKQLIMLQSQYGKILYEFKQSEKARTVFGDLLAKLPKRTDLWMMYAELQLKYGSLEKTREIFQRCLTLRMKQKKLITILKKYYEIEQRCGSEQSAADVLKRAEQVATQYHDQMDADQRDEEEQ